MTRIRRISGGFAGLDCRFGTPWAESLTRRCRMGEGMPPTLPGALLCCAACLHAIVEPERPVLVQDRFFHPGHEPLPPLDAFIDVA